MEPIPPSTLKLAAVIKPLISFTKEFISRTTQFVIPALWVGPPRVIDLSGIFLKKDCGQAAMTIIKSNVA